MDDENNDDNKKNNEHNTNENNNNSNKRKRFEPIVKKKIVNYRGPIKMSIYIVEGSTNKYPKDHEEATWWTSLLQNTLRKHIFHDPSIYLEFKSKDKDFTNVFNIDDNVFDVFPYIRVILDSDYQKGAISYLVLLKVVHNAIIKINKCSIVDILLKKIDYVEVTKASIYTNITYVGQIYQNNKESTRGNQYDKEKDDIVNKYFDEKEKGYQYVQHSDDKTKDTIKYMENEDYT